MIRCSRVDGDRPDVCPLDGCREIDDIEDLDEFHGCPKYPLKFGHTYLPATSRGNGPMRTTTAIPDDSVRGDDHPLEPSGAVALRGAYSTSEQAGTIR